MSHRAHNFSAGPAALPLNVLEEAKAELTNFQETGMSIMEMSHRSKDYEQVQQDATENMAQLLDFDLKEYSVLWMGGGARTQFALVPMNLLDGNSFAEYIDTGAWSAYAIKEAKKIGDTRVAYSSENTGYNHVPQNDIFESDANAKYLHYTSNNTIFGTQFQHIPESNSTLICDMSSDILSRPMNVSKFGVIYAGAQKNMGPAGVTMVIIRKDLLEYSSENLPEVMNYAKVSAKGSMLNTPPVFPIYMVGLVAKHLLKLGGLEVMEKTNQRKASHLYTLFADSHGFYKGHARHDSRSNMNVTFRLPNENLEKQFIEAAAKAQLLGLKGHRSVGGLRASIYNAVPEESVNALVEFMINFQKSNA